jgi:hypothetical protein
VAPKATADAILAEISEVLSRAVTKNIDAQLVSKRPIETSVLNEVARITSTSIRFVKETNEV